MTTINKNHAIKRAFEAQANIAVFLEQLVRLNTSEARTILIIRIREKENVVTNCLRELFKMQLVKRKDRTWNTNRMRSNPNI